MNDDRIIDQQKIAHINEAWQAYDDIAIDFAKRFPETSFTCVRDIYGRCSLAVERLTIDDVEPAGARRLTAVVEQLESAVTSRQDIAPYLGPLKVALLEEGSSLAETIRAARRPLRQQNNAFVVERLLSNESWMRSATSANPEGWPPVVTFYSFKGGVGRSAATALTALTLAREGKRVVILDLDLEAPGIEGYFFASDDAARSDVETGDAGNSEAQPHGGAVGSQDSEGQPYVGAVDYLLERAVLGTSYRPEIDDFVLPYSDPAIAASGGSLLIVPAGRVDETYMERLGRLNLADVGRRHGEDDPFRSLIAALLDWRPVDIILVDCRTGFTDLGGITLNGLSDLDVLVFRGGESDRRYLPIVLRQIQRFREPSEITALQAEKLARSFLIVYSMVVLPAKSNDAVKYVAELREYTSDVVWNLVFKQFAGSGYTYPSEKSKDSPLESVPHDVVLIPYMSDFSMVSSALDMLRIQADVPERPYEALARRLVDVKLALHNAPLTRPMPNPMPSPAASPSLSSREQVSRALRGITASGAGEDDLDTPEHFQRRFLPRAAYRTLLDPRAFLVLGRKGTGKSALFKALTISSEITASLARHLGMDVDVIKKTRWEIGFQATRGFPEPDDFQRLLDVSNEDPDRLANFWRALAAWKLSTAVASPIPGLSTIEDCISKLTDQSMQDRIRRWLDQLNENLAREGRYCCISHDELDIGLTRDSKKRSVLISALVEYWQRAFRILPRIGAKIFLREDIWNREVEITDKAKLREGIDRGTITWDGRDIYRALLKRLGHDEGFQCLLRQEGLWSKDFDDMLGQPLGFIPPEDEDWLKRCINMLGGETMAPGPSGYKKGYVYTWILDHVADSAGSLRPRNALLLFSEAAKLQEESGDKARTEGGVLDPRYFKEAFRESVSRKAVEDLRAEFKQEWSYGGSFLPDKFSALERVWPVEERALIEFLEKEQRLKRKTVVDAIERMSDAGLLERREWRGRPAQIQIPDIYLFGLGLTRKG